MVTWDLSSCAFVLFSVYLYKSGRYMRHEYIQAELSCVSLDYMYPVIKGCRGVLLVGSFSRL